MTKTKTVWTILGLTFFIVGPLLYYIKIFSDMGFYYGILPLFIVQLAAIGLYVLLLIPVVSSKIKWTIYLFVLAAINGWAFSIVHYWFHNLSGYGYTKIGLWPYYLLTSITFIVLLMFMIRRNKPNFILSVAISSSFLLTIYSIFRMFNWLGPGGDDGAFFGWMYSIVPMTIGILVLNTLAVFYKPNIIFRDDAKLKK
ncbi:MAG: hypothetical protein WCE45_04110 [Sedimentisphaerales bacterium]